MIRIFRPPQPPDFGTERSLKRGHEAVAKFLKQNIRQSRFDFSRKYFGGAKQLLMAIQFEKCAYCESPTGVADNGNIENFWPKSKYPERAYDWDNLLVICAACSANKRDVFPLDSSGNPQLIDPCIEEPSLFLSFDERGSALGKTERGDITIRTLALNRRALVDARARAIVNWFAVGDREARESEPYAAAINSAFHARKEHRRRKALGPPKKEVSRSVSVPPLEGRLEFSYIKSIRITNFRAIADFKVSFEEAGWQVLLGENAAGKSTVLKAVALALMGTGHLSTVVDYQDGILHRKKEGRGVREAESGSVVIELFNDEQVVLKLGKSGLKFARGGEGIQGTIRAYGSMRLLSEDDGVYDGRFEAANVRNLFYPQQTLVSAEKLLTWLYFNERSKFEHFATQIKFLLDLKGPIDVKKGILKVPIEGTPVRIAEMSDGYQAMIALAVDLMNGFADHNTMDSAPGILLLDELGTHLHPRWRLEFVSRLRKTFGGLQVIATTHEPLCLRGLKEGEVGVLRRIKGGAVEFLNGKSLPNVAAMRVDQILTSPAFGLHSTIDPDIEAQFEAYYSLLALHNPSEKQKKEMEALETILRPHRHLAYTRRDQMMYEVIDKFLAEDAKISREEKEERKLKDVTMAKLRSIWNETGFASLDGGVS